MPPNAPTPPPIFQRRRARRLAVWNGAVWAIGNGLAGTTLVIYLARELHAERLGLTVGLIVAAPRIAGLLRLGAPALIERIGDRKRFCVACFLFSALMLSVLPWACVPGRLPTPAWSLVALIVLWCLYHLLQYLGTVALWSWLADVAPTKIRGRFLGLRERWMVAGLGAVFMFAALAPLCLMPSMSPRPAAACPKTSHSPVRHSLKSLLSPFRDVRFLPLLLFGCWFSLFNGVTQSAQYYFPVEVLGLPLLVILSLQTGTRLGQWTISPWFGALADRFGNRPVMIVCQLLVGAGLLFFAAATRAHWTWLLGAWVLWIAYAGLNVCLPNLMLKLSPRGTNTSYIAAFEAVRGLCYAVSAIVGGYLVDHWRTCNVSLGCGEVQFFTVLFLFGWVTRSLGSAVLLLVKEPAGQRADRCGTG